MIRHKRKDLPLGEPFWIITRVSCWGGRRGMWKSRTGTNQNRHPAVSTRKMATGRLEQLSSARLKGTDFHKHTGAKASGRAQFPTGRRQALVLEILKHVLNSKHVRTAVDFRLCSPAGLDLLTCTKLPREGMLQQGACDSSITKGVRFHHCWVTLTTEEC